MSSERALALTTGLALFSMFFGSGNLVFPLLVGSGSGGSLLLSTLGLILTAVCVPLLGCLGILLYDGKPEQFFQLLGRKGFLLFSFISLALMGPFGVLARCLTVAHGTFVNFYPDLSLQLFSIVSCLLLFVAAVYRSRLLQILGVWLTPLLLVSLGGIFLLSFFQGGVENSKILLNWDAFVLGSTQGYQTMDLLAALFFSGFVVAQLRSTERNAASLFRVFLRASVIAGLLLGIVYAGLVYLGFQYSAILESVAPQSMLATIASHAMGPYGGIIVCATFALACYTTALVLTVLFADFLRKELCQDKIPQWLSVGVTLVIAYLISTLEFSGIAQFLGPILETVYPLLIALTIWNIAKKRFDGDLALKYYES